MATLPQITGKRAIPQVVPGSPLFDENFRDYARQVDDALQDIYNYINNITNEVNVTNIGFGTAAGEWIIGQSTPGLTTSQEATTHGGTCFRKLKDGQLVVCWHEFLGGGNNTVQLRVVKAVAPYTTWTNLEGTSQDATTIVPSFAMSGSQAPLFVQRKDNSDLLFFEYNVTTGNVIAYTYTFDGTNFASSGNAVVATGVLDIGDAICTDECVILTTRSGGVNGGKIYSAQLSTYTTLGWILRASYIDILNGGIAYSIPTAGLQRSLVDLGDGRVLYLTEMLNGSTTSLGWAMSTNNGLTWDAVSTTALTGSLFPMVLDTYPTGSLAPSAGTPFSQWNAALLEGTARVGLCYLSLNAAASGNQRAGVMYCEFDADTGTWTAQADHVLLTPHNTTAADSPLLVFNGSVGFLSMGGKAVCGSGGTPRCFWFHGYDTAALTQDTQLSIGYRRLNDGGTITNTFEWQTQRDVIRFSAKQSDVYYRLSEFAGCKDGAVTVAGVEFYPVMWVRRADTSELARFEVCMQMLPIAVIDAP